MKHQRVNVKDLKKGDKFYESEYGMTAHCEALEDARLVDTETRKGYACNCSCTVDGNTGEGEYFEAHESHGYGPKIYREEV